VKRRPIIFTGDSPRLIIEGKKTMTRRVMKPQPSSLPVLCPNVTSKGQPSWVSKHSAGSLIQLCPYGQPGDRLWVKEAYINNKKPLYKADFKPLDAAGILGLYSDKSHWGNPMYMPKAISRIRLEILSICVERLQDISEDAAKAEGAEAKRWGELKYAPLSLLGGKGSVLPSDPRYRYGFYELWDSINAKRGYSWGTNPWVWVISFRRIDP